MIEFAIAFLEATPNPGPTTVEAHFTIDSVRLVAVNIAEMTHEQWDERRARVINSGHSDWPSVYKGTPLEVDLRGPLGGGMAVEGMMAFGALHLLAPAAATAMQLADDPSSLRATYPRAKMPDGLGNHIRLLESPLSADRNRAADEMFDLGMLNRLEVVVCPSPGRADRLTVYFAPFHMPGIASDKLSNRVVALKASLP